MPRPRHRELSTAEFDAWCAQKDQLDATCAAADEGGGPTLSLVPAEQRELAWPTDLIPAVIPDYDQPMRSASPIDGIALQDSRNRLAGWSADRQRLFLAALAETGSVHLASGEARLTARSAYRLRTRSPAFATAWDAALQLAVGRLSAVAFDRALNGRIEQVYRDDELIAERRVPRQSGYPLGTEPVRAQPLEHFHRRAALAVGMGQ